MLGRGVRVEHVGVLRLQVLQTAKFDVKLVVRQGRGIEYIVLVIGLFQFFAQRQYLLALGSIYL